MNIEKTPFKESNEPVVDILPNLVKDVIEMMRKEDIAEHSEQNSMNFDMDLMQGNIEMIASAKKYKKFDEDLASIYKSTETRNYKENMDHLMSSGNSNNFSPATLRYIENQSSKVDANEFSEGNLSKMSLSPGLLLDDPYFNSNNKEKDEQNKGNNQENNEENDYQIKEVNKEENHEENHNENNEENEVFIMKRKENYRSRLTEFGLKNILSVIEENSNEKNEDSCSWKKKDASISSQNSNFPENKENFSIMNLVFELENSQESSQVNKIQINNEKKNESSQESSQINKEMKNESSQESSEFNKIQGNNSKKTESSHESSQINNDKIQINNEKKNEGFNEEKSFAKKTKTVNFDENSSSSSMENSSQIRKKYEKTPKIVKNRKRTYEEIESSFNNRLEKTSTDKDISKKMKFDIFNNKDQFCEIQKDQIKNEKNDQKTQINENNDQKTQIHENKDQKIEINLFRNQINSNKNQITNEKKIQLDSPKFNKKTKEQCFNKLIENSPLSLPQKNKLIELLSSNTIKSRSNMDLIKSLMNYNNKSNNLDIIELLRLELKEKMSLGQNTAKILFERKKEFMQIHEKQEKMRSEILEKKENIEKIKEKLKAQINKKEEISAMKIFNSKCSSATGLKFIEIKENNPLYRIKFSISGSEFVQYFIEINSKNRIISNFSSNLSSKNSLEFEENANSINSIIFKRLKQEIEQNHLKNVFEIMNRLSFYLNSCAFLMKSLDKLERDFSFYKVSMNSENSTIELLIKFFNNQKKFIKFEINLFEWFDEIKMTFEGPEKFNEKFGNFINTIYNSEITKVGIHKFDRILEKIMNMKLIMKKI